MSDIVVIWNGRAGSAEAATEVGRALAARDDVSVVRLGEGADARQAACRAATEGARRVIAAGGDGTVNAVANGLIDAEVADVELGILPLGTANDLSRTLAMPQDPLAALGVLDAGRLAPLDVVRVEGEGQVHRYVNVATGGFSGLVIAATEDATKERWGSLAYLREALGLLAEREVYTLTLRFDDGPEEVHHLFNIIVANGRTSAGGFAIAPRASTEDGLLDVVMIRDGSIVDLLEPAARVLVGDYLESELVAFRRAKRLELTPAHPIRFSADGEVVGGDRVTFEVEPARLRVVVGPHYAPTPV